MRKMKNNCFYCTFFYLGGEGGVGRVLGMKPRASQVLGKHSTTEPFCVFLNLTKFIHSHS
jgi:hypothetical protein